MSDENNNVSELAAAAADAFNEAEGVEETDVESTKEALDEVEAEAELEEIDELAMALGGEEADQAEGPEEELEAVAVNVEGTELEAYESSEVEETEFIEIERVMSIVESVLFSTDRPQSISTIKQAFKGTNVKSKEIRKAIEELMVEYAGANRGVSIEEVTGGYQLRTKTDNMDYLKRMVKSRPFKLSGPALEVLSIVAYKQPCAKLHVDEVRGVESGHLLRGLMDKGLCAFAGKSELPGKPMLYQTTRKFLEIFGLRNLKELPTLSEIDELLPEGIEPEQVEKKETLDQVADSLQQDAVTSYSAAADELEKITDSLSDINTSSEFFEQEKRREKERRDKERAQDIREALEFGEEVTDKDKRWLEKYDAAQLEAQQQAEATTESAGDDILAESEQSTEVVSEDADELSMAIDDATEALESNDQDAEVLAGEESAQIIEELSANETDDISEGLAPYDSGIPNIIDDFVDTDPETEV